MSTSKPSEISDVMAKVDEHTDSPGKRASKVLVALRMHPSITTWDVLCFCAEYLGMMVPAYGFLEEDARRLTRLVYLAHYIHYSGPADEKTIREVLG